MVPSTPAADAPPLRRLSGARLPGAVVVVVEPAAVAPVEVVPVLEPDPV